LITQYGFLVKNILRPFFTRHPKIFTRNHNHKKGDAEDSLGEFTHLASYKKKIKNKRKREKMGFNGYFYLLKISKGPKLAKKSAILHPSPRFGTKINI